MVVPLTLVLSVPPLLWFAHHWTVFGDDSGRYLLAASQLISGQALEDLNTISEFNGGHGPVFPALIGALIVAFGRDTAELVWTVQQRTYPSLLPQDRPRWYQGGIRKPLVEY